MARQTPADHLAAEVLARPDFARACGNRDLGEVLRLAKQWGGVGFSASHLARRCELTVSRVQDYINGRVQAQRVEVFERVADGLHIPGKMFDLGPRPWETDTDQSDAGPSAGRPGTWTAEGESSVLRRDFVKLGAGVAASAVASSVGVPSRSAGNRIGSSTVAELRANMARLRPLDDHLGGADTYRLYLAEVERTAGLLKDASFSGPVRQELLTLFAEEAQQAGWAAFDAGWHAQAQQLYERSFTAAREAHDAALVGNALALRAYQTISNGSDATGLTDKSLSIAGSDVHPAVKSLLYQRGAWTYAVAGDAQKATEALGLAEGALTDSAVGAPAPEWAGWAHSTTELQIMAGRCWTELHKPLRAVPALEAAMADYDDSHARDKALYLSWLADAYLDGGELDTAVAVTDHALTLAADVASSRPQQRLDAVMDRFEEHEAEPGVSDLLARRPLNPVKVWS